MTFVTMWNSETVKGWNYKVKKVTKAGQSVIIINMNF